MRCFIALPLPLEIKDALESVQSQLKSESSKIRWVAKKNLHLTLKFLGDIDETKVNLTKQTLSSLSFRSFQVKLGPLGVFPSSHHPKILWVDLIPQQDIFSLQGEIDLALGFLFKKEERFTVHLTIGRIVTLKKPAIFFQKLNEFHVPPLSFNFTSFELFKSTLATHGPSYTLLETYHLT